MICPFCKSDKVKVIDTRKYDTVVIRARFCLSCKKYFKTQEEFVFINSTPDPTYRTRKT